jgi:hypothetical protein
MAKVTSGSFNTTKYSDRYLVFSWTCTQDISKNQSTISWTLKGAGGTSTKYYMSAPFSVTIAGEEVYYSKDRIQLLNGTTVASGTKVITHKTDGTKSLSASVKAAIYYSSYNVDGSGTWDLKDIPRAATITSATDFDDEGTPVIKYSNPAGSNATVKVGLYWNSSTAFIDYVTASNAKTGEYTFSLTSAQRTAIQKKLANTNSMTIYYYIRTYIDSKLIDTSKIAKKVSIVNATPTLSPTVEDINSWSIALTGNKNTLIHSLSNAQATSNYGLKKYATLKSITIKNGDDVINAASGTFSECKNKTFVFTVVDSRGNTTSQTITKGFINSVATSCHLEVSNATGEGEVTYTISGAYYNGSFGIDSNYLGLTLLYKKESETSWTTVSISNYDISLSDNSYTITDTLTGLDYTSKYEIEARAVSCYDTVYSKTLSFKAQPVFDWSEEDFNFNVPVTINGISFQSVVNAMTERYYLPTTITAATGYKSASTSDAILVGNNLRCYFKITKNTIPIGNMANEKVCSLTISHSGKIKNMYDGGVSSGSAGALNAYYLANVKKDETNNTITFDIYLAASANDAGDTATADADMSGMFTIPVVINLNAY